ncbi:hypothetical protein ACPUGQ_23090, partial [Klebsiella aerogenes]|uniref:hypothetical protein n=1 Tax=Klebsiella aerogenes TaxID=548 RepID=UPI003D355D07
YCLKTQPATGETYPKSDLFNKAPLRLKNYKQSENSMLVNNGRQENKSRKIPKLRWFLFARYTLT